MSVVHLHADGMYVATLEPRQRRVAARWLVAALDLWCAMNGGTFELTRAGDVVVRRRTDGHEALRVKVRTADESASVLDQVRGQLLSTTPEQFRRRWGLTEAA